ncbi:MAG: DUF1223 domain-containing protein [Pseudomonadota bacterium]
MRQILGSLAIALSIFVAPVSAGGPVVVELFTSQGCSSCPPADKLLHELAKRDDVIALALHVDYWDYIGWKDEFADPMHTDRQRGYAIEAGRRSVYTPQMIVNGITDIVGTRPMELTKSIAEHAARPSTVALDLQRADKKLIIKAETKQALSDLLVQLVRYNPEEVVKITRGENAGHTLKYGNIATDWVILAEWNGRRPLDLEVDIGSDEPVVVLIQQGKYGPIVAADQLR